MKSDFLVNCEVLGLAISESQPVRLLSFGKVNPVVLPLTPYFVAEGGAFYVVNFVGSFNELPRLPF